MPRAWPPRCTATDDLHTPTATHDRAGVDPAPTGRPRTGVRRRERGGATPPGRGPGRRPRLRRPGAYGQKLITTPHIDRLAAEGLRFTDAYSAAAVCAPSRAAFLTGLHTVRAAVRANPAAGGPGGLAAGDTTFAEVLRARGYRTGLFGKWGFGPEAADQPSHPGARARPYVTVV
ncbi:sulfatase-like hydrolase/transferase [Streptomyces sp. NPDC085540]|uniref:sulfatase-like hydrolase/transferase n=1 Tax=Streptomyces sp. NPDC085540 TaxID=3365730 RepID=UPI0037CEACC7